MQSVAVCASCDKEKFPGMVDARVGHGPRQLLLSGKYCNEQILVVAEQRLAHAVCIV